VRMKTLRSKNFLPKMKLRGQSMLLPDFPVPRMKTPHSKNFPPLNPRSLARAVSYLDFPVLRLKTPRLKTLKNLSFFHPFMRRESAGSARRMRTETMKSYEQ